jgi:hypothetical protein
MARVPAHLAPSHHPPVKFSIDAIIDAKRDQPQPSRSHPFAESIPVNRLAIHSANAFPRS